MRDRVHVSRKRLRDGSVKEYRYRRRQRQGTVAGTMGRLLEEYKASPQFRALKPSSRRVYEYAMEILLTHAAAMDVVALRRADIVGMRDVVAASHGNSAANMFSAVLSTMLTYAMDRGYRDDHPGLRMKRLATGEYERWSDAEVSRVLDRASGTVAMGILLALYTGQRIGDICAMRWDAYDGEGLRVRQQKTGEELYIPAARVLKAALDEWKLRANGLTILTTRKGKPMSTKGLRQQFERIRTKAGVAKQFHGLRKTAAANLAELGCADRVIAALTGHKSLQMISHYTKQADQKVRALEAIRRVDAADTRVVVLKPR